QRIDTIFIPCDHLLTWKVDLKADNVGINCMHLISHQTPKSLALRDVACIQIELDLILTLAKLHSGTVMALVDILVDVLDASDRADALHVDMTAILPEQKDAEGNIVNFHAVGEGICLFSVTTAEVGIRVIGDGGLVTEWLGKTLGALSILHALSSGILWTAGSVDHVLHHQFMKHWMSVRIRDLSREELVEFIRSLKLGVGMEKDDEMGVRQAALLKLVGVAVSDGFAQASLFHDIVEHLLALHVEDSTDNVWTISWLLARKKSCFDFWPARIGGHSGKEIGSLEVTVEGQRILTAFLHVPCAPSEGGWKNDAHPNVGWIGSWIVLDGGGQC